jgi:single-stranded DNA-binding protein
MSQNHVRIGGGMTRDPDFSYTPQGGYPVWRATIAVNGTRYNSESRQQEVSTSFILLSAGGFVAESLMEAAFVKGDEILVDTGELEQREWEKDGKREHRTQVNVLSWSAVRKRASTPPRQEHGVRRPDPGEDPWANVGGRHGGPDSEPPF